MASLISMKYCLPDPSVQVMAREIMEEQIQVIGEDGRDLHRRFPSGVR
jgi:hypothetical protein